MQRYDFAFGWVLCRWAMGTWESKESKFKIKIPKQFASISVFSEVKRVCCACECVNVDCNMIISAVTLTRCGESHSGRL